MCSKLNLSDCLPSSFHQFDLKELREVTWSMNKFKLSVTCGTDTRVFTDFTVRHYIEELSLLWHNVKGEALSMEVPIVSPYCSVFGGLQFPQGKEDMYDIVTSVHHHRKAYERCSVVQPGPQFQEDLSDFGGFDLWPTHTQAIQFKTQVSTPLAASQFIYQCRKPNSMFHVTYNVTWNTYWNVSYTNES